jgi:hypothetical protein
MTVTTTTIPRDEVWRAFRGTPDVRLRERYHCVLLLGAGAVPRLHSGCTATRTPCGDGYMPSTMRDSKGWSANRPGAPRVTHP